MNIEELIKSSQPICPRKELIINLWITSSNLNVEVAESVKSFGISMQQFNVLRILRGQKGKPANLQTIQERMVHKMSNTTRLVDKLIEKKLTERFICENNRRKVEITITRKGMSLLDELDPIVAEAEERCTKNLSVKEVETLNNLLNKLRE